MPDLLLSYKHLFPTELIKRKEEEILAYSNGNQLLYLLPHFYPQSLTLKELELQELSELSFVCTAFTAFQNMSFHYLRWLIVEQCGKVKCILSMSVWGSLPKLILLDIRECEEVEKIIQEPSEEVSNSNMHYQSPFPELEGISVKGCHKLKCLFRTATVGMLLPQLKWIEVSEAAQIEELFSNMSDEETPNMQQIELPNLHTLSLSNLPTLAHFSKGLNLNAPYLHNIQINECPKFEFSSLVEDTSTESTEQVI